MAESLIGAGGWGYFSGGLEAYSKGFRFVEVNATFYRRIPEAMARRCRNRVPSDFVFSIKAHRDVTHAGRLIASAAVRDAFGHSLRTPGSSARRSSSWRRRRAWRASRLRFQG